MRHLFSTDGEAALRAVMQRRPLLAFDFDGTLAPIVARPDQATVPEPVSRGLAKLAERWPVAVITGRSVADVSPRLGFTPRYIIGNHGVEYPMRGVPESSSAALDVLRHRLRERAE